MNDCKSESLVPESDGMKFTPTYDIEFTSNSVADKPILIKYRSITAMFYSNVHYKSFEELRFEYSNKKGKKESGTTVFTKNIANATFPKSGEHEKKFQPFTFSFLTTPFTFGSPSIPGINFGVTLTNTHTFGKPLTAVDTFGSSACFTTTMATFSSLSNSAFTRLSNSAFSRLSNSAFSYPYSSTYPYSSSAHTFSTPGSPFTRGNITTSASNFGDNSTNTHIFAAPSILSFNFSNSSPSLISYSKSTSNPTFSHSNSKTAFDTYRSPTNPANNTSSTPKERPVQKEKNSFNATFNSSAVEKALLCPDDPPLFCIICVENQRNILFEPCGHLVVCSTCSNRIKKECPMCKKCIKKKIKAYLN